MNLTVRHPGFESPRHGPVAGLVAGPSPICRRPAFKTSPNVSLLHDAIAVGLLQAGALHKHPHQHLWIRVTKQRATTPASFTLHSGQRAISPLFPLQLHRHRLCFQFLGRSQSRITYFYSQSFYSHYSHMHEEVSTPSLDLAHPPNSTLCYALLSSTKSNPPLTPHVTNC